MTFNHHLIKISGIVLLSIFTFNTVAHERFILPSHTLLSGDKAQAVTLTSSISNDIFHPDRPLGDSNTGADLGTLKRLFSVLQHTVITPDGRVTHDTRWQAFERLSVADVWLNEPGTYRVGLVQPNVFMTTFKNADGAPERIFGKDVKLPPNAKDIKRRASTSRVETFLTLNSPTHTAVKPTGKGLELGGATHPNDLFAGETAEFQLFFNGKAMKDEVTLKVIKGGTRHRNDRNEVNLVVNKEGKFTFTPESAGFYFMVGESKINIPQPAELDVQHFGLYLTLEVFPE